MGEMTHVLGKTKQKMKQKQITSNNMCIIEVFQLILNDIIREYNLLGRNSPGKFIKDKSYTKKC